MRFAFERRTKSLKEKKQTGGSTWQIFIAMDLSPGRGKIVGNHRARTISIDIAARDGEGRRRGGGWEDGIDSLRRFWIAGRKFQRVSIISFTRDSAARRGGGRGRGGRERYGVDIRFGGGGGGGGGDAESINRIIARRERRSRRPSPPSPRPPPPGTRVQLLIAAVQLCRGGCAYVRPWLCSTSAGRVVQRNQRHVAPPLPSLSLSLSLSLVHSGWPLRVSLFAYVNVYVCPGLACVPVARERATTYTCTHAARRHSHARRAWFVRVAGIIGTLSRHVEKTTRERDSAGGSTARSVAGWRINGIQREARCLSARQA